MSESRKETHHINIFKHFANESFDLQLKFVPEPFVSTTTIISRKQIKKYTYLELDEPRSAKYIGRITYQSASVLNQQTFAGLKSKS